MFLPTADSLTDLRISHFAIQTGGVHKISGVYYIVTEIDLMHSISLPFMIFEHLHFRTSDMVKASALTYSDVANSTRRK